jgi:hypothetical protein
MAGTLSLRGVHLLQHIDELPRGKHIVLIFDYNGTYWVQKWTRRAARQLAGQLTSVEKFSNTHGPDEHLANCEYTAEGHFGIRVILQ